MIKPLGERVLIKRETEKKIGKIVLSQDAQNTKKVVTGIVEDVGEVKTLKKGDRAFFRQFTAHEIEVGDDTYSIIKEEEVLGYER